MTLLWIVIALPFVFVCVLLYVLPYLSRRTQFFAVTVPWSFRQSDPARRIIRTYRYQVVIHSALGLVGYVLMAVRNAPGWLWLVLVWPTLGSLIAVVFAHRDTLHYAVPPAGVRTASLEPRRQALPGGPLVWSGPLALLAASAVYIRLHWNQIPARFPIHWGMHNQPNGWADHTLLGVYRPLLIGIVVCLLLQWLAWQLVMNSRGSTAMRRLVARLLLAITYLIAALFAWLTAAMPLGHGAPSALALGIIMGTVAAVISASIIFGLRAKAEPEPNKGPFAASVAPQSMLGLDQPAGDNTADRDWRGGLIYFNPDDPALFVEKRIGIGYDLNFGNPRAWVFLGALLMIPAALALLARL